MAGFWVSSFDPQGRKGVKHQRSGLDPHRHRGMSLSRIFVPCRDSRACLLLTEKLIQSSEEHESKDCPKHFVTSNH